MKTTYTTKEQYVPTLTEVESYFTENGLSASYGRGWFSQMENKAWLDSKGNKIMNWRMFARFKINDFKGDDSAKKEIHIPVQESSSEPKDLAPNLFIIAEGIVQLIEKYTNRINEHNMGVSLKLIQLYQSKNNSLSPIELEQGLIKLLAQITKKEKFSYDYLLSDLEKAIKNPPVP